MRNITFKINWMILSGREIQNVNPDGCCFEVDSSISLRTRHSSNFRIDLYFFFLLKFLAVNISMHFPYPVPVIKSFLGLIWI